MLKHRWLGALFQHNFLGDVIPPGITVVAQAVRSDNKNQGYQATAYVRSDAAKVDVQLVVVQLAETNWKVCADAVILPLKAQVSAQAASHRETSTKPRAGTENLLIRSMNRKGMLIFLMFHKVGEVSGNVSPFF